MWKKRVKARKTAERGQDSPGQTSEFEKRLRELEEKGEIKGGKVSGSFIFRIKRGYKAAMLKLKSKKRG